MATRTDLEQLVFQLSADVNRMEKALDRARGGVNRRAEQIQSRLDRLGRDAGRAFLPMQRAAQIAFAAITAYSVKAAMDADEVADAFGVAFGTMRADAQAFVNTFVDGSRGFVRSEMEMQSGMTRLQLVFDGLGVSAERAFEMTRALTERGVDISSLWNVDDAQALQAIISGITGETEPLKRFGVVLNQTAIEAELLRLGFQGNASEASEAAKAIARTNIILQRTATAHGNAADTADSAANQVRQMRAEFTNAAVDLGRELLPAMVAATEKATDLIRAFSELDDGVKLAGLGLLALAAASGPIAATVRGLVTLVTWARTASAALAGLGAAGGAGGAGAAAAGAGAAGGSALLGVGLIGLAGASGLSAAQRNRTLERVRQSRLADVSDQDLANALEWSQVQLNRMHASLFEADLATGRFEPRRNTSSRQVAERNQLAAERDRLRAETQRRAGRSAAQSDAATAEAADATARAALAGLEGFGLGDEAGGGGGGGGGGRGGAQARAAADRAARDALRRQRSLEDQLLRAGDDLLRAQMEVASTAEERLALALEGLERDRQARAVDLDRAEADGELTAAERAELEAAEEAVRAQEEANLRAEARSEIEERRAQAEQDLLDLTMELLSLQASGARTAAERRRIELRLLDLAQADARRALEDRMEGDPDLTDADRAARRQALSDLQAAQRAALLRSTMGPLEAWRDSGLQTAAELNEAFELVAANGLEALNRGLVDAMMGARSLGEVFREVARGIIADLMAIAVRKNITEPLAGLLFGGGAAAGGGIFAAIASRFAGGFATGGHVPAGQWGVLGERGPEPVFGGRTGVTVLPNHALARAASSTAQSGAARVARIEFRQTIDLTGANGDETIRRIAYEASAEGAAQAYAAARSDLDAAVTARRQQLGTGFV